MYAISSNFSLIFLQSFSVQICTLPYCFSQMFTTARRSVTAVPFLSNFSLSLLPFLICFSKILSNSPPHSTLWLILDLGRQPSGTSCGGTHRLTFIEQTKLNASPWDRNWHYQVHTPCHQVTHSHL